MNLIERVKEILIEELNLDSVVDDATQEDYAEWDSLSYLRVIAALENEFGWEITPSNINNFNSIPNIVKEISAMKNSR